MKKPPINLQRVLFAQYAANKAFISKFKYYWGTTVINGSEVLNAELEIYPNLSSKTKKLLIMLNSYEGIKKEKFKGVERAWLKLDPSKGDNIEIDVVKLKYYLSNRLNDYQTDINNDRSDDNQILDFTFTLSIDVKYSAAVDSLIRTDWNTCLDKYRITSHSSDILKAITMVLPIVQECKVQSIEHGRRKQDTGTYVATVSVTFTIPFTLIPLNTVANKIVDICKYSEDISNRHSLSNSMKSPKIQNIAYIKTLVFKQVPVNPDINMWVTVPIYSTRSNGDDDEEEEYISGYTYYLRTSFLDSTTVPDGDKVAYVASCISSDYEEKEVSALVKAVMIVVTVVAVVLSVYTGGASLTLIQLATVVLLVSITFTIEALLMASWGDYAGANSINKLNKQISPYVELASVVLLISGGVDLYKALQASWKSAGIKAVQIGSSQLNVFMSDLATSIGNSLINASTKDILKGITFLTDIYYKNKIEDIQKRNIKDKNELAKQRKAIEESKQTHLGLEILASIGKDLSADWSRYAAIYDKPYDPTHPLIHIGNVQATEVDAFLFADYT